MHCTVLSTAYMSGVPPALCCVCRCFTPQATVALCDLTALLQVDLDLDVHLTTSAKEQSLDCAVLVVAVDKMTTDELREIDRHLVYLSSLAMKALL